MNDNNNCINSCGFLLRACKNADSANNGQFYKELIKTSFQVYSKYSEIYLSEV